MFTDTASTSIAPRHMPQAHLEVLPPVLNLHDSFGGEIEPSPAKSANSDIEVRVENTYSSLLDRMRRDLLSEIDQRIEARETARMAEKDDFVEQLFRAHGIRNIEDWAIGRMREELGLSKVSDVTYSVIIDRFVKEFDFDGVTPRDLEQLKFSSARTQANLLFHINLQNTDSGELLRFWTRLRPSLIGEEKPYYEKMMQFCRKKNSVSRKDVAT
jgi:hypothetical protein